MFEKKDIKSEYELLLTARDWPDDLKDALREMDLPLGRMAQLFAELVKHTERLIKPEGWEFVSSEEAARPFAEFDMISVDAWRGTGDATLRLDSEPRLNDGVRRAMKRRDDAKLRILLFFIGRVRGYECQRRELLRVRDVTAAGMTLHRRIPIVTP